MSSIPFSLSPAVTWEELDQTSTIPATSATSAGYAGKFRWGPVNQAVQLSSENDLLKFGGSPDSYTFVDYFVASNHLRYNNDLTVFRACHTATAKNAVATGAAIQILNPTMYTINYAGGEDTTNGTFCAKYVGEYGNNILVSMADAGNFGSWPYAAYFGTAPGTTPFVANVGGSNDQVHIIVIDSDGHITGTPGTVLERFPNLSKAVDAVSPDGSISYYPSVLFNNSAYIYWLDWPTGGTNWGTTSAGTSFVTLFGSGTFASVTGSGFSVGETMAVYSGAVSAINVTAAGTGYTSVPTATLSAPTLAGGITATATVTLSTTTVGSITITNPGSGYTAPPTVTITGGGGTSATATAVVTYGTNPVKTAVDLTYSSGGHTITYNEVTGSFTVGDLVTGLTSGSTGVLTAVTHITTTATMTGGISGNSVITDSDYINAYAYFINAETYDIRILLGGQASSAVANYLISDIAGVRLDCVVFLSPPQAAVVNNTGNEPAALQTFRNTLPSSSYAFLDDNWKYMLDTYNNVYRWIPCNADSAGLFVQTANNYAAWYAFSGYNRGILKNVTKLAWNATKSQRDILFPQSINSIVQQNGFGAVLLGDATLYNNYSELNSVNVRNCLIVIEKAVTTAAKYTLFEFNDAISQSAFKSLVNPYLRSVQGGRGISYFFVQCDSSNNTPAVVNAAGFVANIILAPQRATRFINLSFTVVGAGVTITESVQNLPS